MMTQRERDRYSQELNRARHEGLMLGRREAKPRFLEGVLLGFVLNAVMALVVFLFWPFA